ncbi:MAG: substrate-binding domain-containing protein, partial [Acidimicrobiales bacterium]
RVDAIELPAVQLDSLVAHGRERRDLVEQAGGRLPQRVELDPQAGRALAADPTVTAIFVANDQMALGVMLALHDARRRVPEDVSVVGFDDTPESEYYSPPLTTVRQDLGEVGRLGVDLLLGVIAGTEPHRVSIEPTFVLRSSTAPPPAR